MDLALPLANWSTPAPLRHHMQVHLRQLAKRNQDGIAPALDAACAIGEIPHVSFSTCSCIATTTLLCHLGLKKTMVGQDPRISDRSKRTGDRALA